MSFNKKSGFTLYELLIAMTIFFVVIAMVMKFYVYLLGLKTGLEGRQTLVEQSYYMLERMQVQIKDYNIDYEEYFNRQQVGCTTARSVATTPFTWEINVGDNGYCSQFTSYGNENAFSSIADIEQHQFYYCTSRNLASDPKKVIKDDDLRIGKGCISQARSSLGNNTTNGRVQSFGQYHMHFKDVNDDADTVTGAVGDDDDEDLGLGPDAIGQATGVQELYLISKDHQKRLFFRRALTESGNYDGSGGTNLDSEKLQTIQFLKLQGLDVGDDHIVGNLSEKGLYDGQIDTRACDFQAGFLCNGTKVNGTASLYSGYALPVDKDDGWVKMFSNNITIPQWNLSIYPTKDPSYAWAEDTVQINPYIQIGFQAKLYGAYWFKRLPSIDTYTFSIQTTFNIHSFYGK